MLSGCSSFDHRKRESINDKNKMKVYTTVYAFQSLTQQIGGKYVDTQSIYPAGADLHSYEPTQKDMIDIAKSDLFVYSSHQLDPVAAKITNSMTNNSMKLALAEGLKQSDFIHSKDHDENHEHHSHHEESNQDPHVWLDPVLNQKFAFMIKEKLIEKDAKHQAYYNKNYKIVNKDIVHID